MPGLHHIWSIMDMCQVRKYLDSTIFQGIDRIKMADDNDVK